MLPVAYRKTDSEVFRTVVEGTLHRQKLLILYRKLSDKDHSESRGRQKHDPSTSGAIKVGW